MKVWGVIPARWGATRLPGKSLLPLLGKPMIQWVAERARQAESLDRLVVATDDERIAAAVAGLGVETVMTRSDHPSGTDRVAEAVRGGDADLVINIQGDEPLLDPDLVDRLVATLRDGPDWDMATAATPIRDEREWNDPAVVKVVWDRQGAALYFSRAPIPFSREPLSAADGDGRWRHVGLYAYRRRFLEQFVQTAPSWLERVEKLEQLRALHLGARLAVLQTEDRGCGVDTPRDVETMERLLRLEGKGI